MSITFQVLREVETERERQIDVCKHDGDTELADRINTPNDWIAFICAYAGRGADHCIRNQREDDGFRVYMIKVAALAVAAVEAHDKGWAAVGGAGRGS